MKKRISAALAGALGFVSLAAPPAAQAFDKAKFTGVLVLHCSEPIPSNPDRDIVFSFDFSTMRETDEWLSKTAHTLHWVGDGPALTLIEILAGHESFPHWKVNLETGLIIHLLPSGEPQKNLNEYTVRDPVTGNLENVTFPKPCHDDNGLVPAPEYTEAGAAEIAAALRPSIDDAKAAARKLTAAQKKQAQTKFAQAFDLFKTGDFTAAILGFKQGLDIDPSSGIANFYLGECYARTNKDHLAKIRWQRTIDLAPGSKEALQAQSRLTKS